MHSDTMCGVMGHSNVSVFIKASYICLNCCSCITRTLCFHLNSRKWCRENDQTVYDMNMNVVIVRFKVCNLITSNLIRLLHVLLSKESCIINDSLHYSIWVDTGHSCCSSTSGVRLNSAKSTGLSGTSAGSCRQGNTVLHKHFSS